MPKKVTETVHIVDWFPTLAALVGSQPDPSNAIDGLDLAPALFNSETLPARNLYWIWSSQSNRWALRWSDWKIVRYSPQEPREPSDWQLFNLQDDRRRRYPSRGGGETTRYVP